MVALAGAGDLTGVVSLSWNSNPETNIAGYRVRYGTSADALLQSQTFDWTTSTSKITGLETGKTYYFAVQAYNIGGLDGPLSDQASAFIEIPTYPEISVERPSSILLADGQAGGAPENIREGTAGTPQSYLVRNVGTAALTGLAMTVDGANPGEFSITTDLPLVTYSAVNGDFESSLSGWASSGNIRVSTYSAATGTNSIAEFNYANNTPNGVISQSFATQPGTTYKLSFDVGVLAYNTNQQALLATVTGSGNLLSKTITVNGAGDGTSRWTAQSLTFVANNTVTTLTFSDVSTTTAAIDLLLDHVQVTSPASAPAASVTSLAPGTATAFTITFKPLSAGTKSAAIHITSNDADENPFDLTFAGNGLAQSENPALPEISVSRGNGVELVDGSSSLDFGTLPPGSTSGIETFVIKNTGPGELKNLSVAIDGPDAGRFPADPLVTQSLAAGESTTLRVAFQPASSGLHTANLHITSNDADEDVFDIALSGSGTALPEIVLEDSSSGELFDGTSTIDFINTVPGSRSTPRIFTIRNAGHADLTGIAVSVSGANAADFIVENPPTTVLGPAAATTFQIVFTPDAAGSRAATLHVASNDASEPSFDIAMTGNGVTFPEIAIERSDGTNLADATGSVGFPGTLLGSTSTAEVVTVRNLDTAPLADISVTLDGENASDFLLHAPDAVSLAPGSSASFGISFAPSAAGRRTASIHVSSNDADESFFTIALAGSGVALPEIAVERANGESLADASATVSFGDVDAGSSSPGQLLTIRNNGSAALTGIALSISGGDAADFSVEGPAASSIAPGGSASFTLHFTPDTAGASSASLLIASNDADENPFSIALSGNGIPQPEIAVELSSGEAVADGTGALAFSNVNVGSASTAGILIIRNPGTAPLTGLAVSLTGSHTSDFTATSPLVTTLAPGAATSIKVFFKPTASGTRAAALRIASNDADENPFDIALGGNGVAVPEIAVERSGGESLTDGSSSVNFSPANLGTTSAGEILTLRNAGSAPLTGIALTVAGGHPADFIIDGPGISTLAPGTSATFKISFKPTASGTRAAALRIASNDADENPFDIALGGNAIALPHLVLATAAGVPFPENPASAGFESVKIGTTGPARTFSISNSGTADLTNLKLTLDGPQASDFILESTTSTRLAPAAGTNFKITFKPLGSGTRNAVLHLASNDPDENPFDLLLSGTGMAVPQISILRSGIPLTNGNATLAFGNVNLGSVSAFETLTIRNQGTAELSNLAATVDGVFGADFIIRGLETSTLAPGSSTTFQVSFSPSAAGSRSSELQITSNDAETGPFRLDLTGGGVAFPVMAVETADGSPLAPGTTPLLFDSVILGATGSPQTFLIRNTGTAPLSGLRISSFGPDADSFIAGAAASDSLKPGAGTTFTITFKPAAGGPRTAGLRITHDSLSAGPFEILLSGDGVTLPGINLRNADGIPLPDRATENFGTSDIISQPRARTYTIANTGSAKLTDIALSLEGPGASDFTVANLGATSLAPGAATTFSLLFKPGATGARYASLLIHSNAGEKPLLLALAGKGLSSPEIQILLAGRKLKAGDTFINFGSTPLGSRGESRTFTLSNIGSASLDKISISKNGINPADFTVSILKTDSLAPGTGTTFNVTFRPAEAGIRWAAIHVLSTDRDEKSFDIVLTGKGSIKNSSAFSKSGTPPRHLAASPAAPRPAAGPTRKGTIVVNGRKHRTLTLTKAPGIHPAPGDIEVSPNLIDWSSGPLHTTVLCDTPDTLTVRDNTPLAPGTKRYIRLKSRAATSPATP